MNSHTTALLCGLVIAALMGGQAVAADSVERAADASRAMEEGPSGAAALVRVLRRYHEAGDGEGGFEWWLRLPFAIRAQQVQLPEVRLWRNRLEFLRDAQRGDATSCAVSGPAVLRLPMPSHDVDIERERLERCLSKAK